MKRSEVNALLKASQAFLKKMHFHLPPFAFWTLADWRKNFRQAGEITRCMLGWDITDFGSGNFPRCGLILFTLRNGVLNSRKYPKPYAEKIMIVREGQVTPMHFHWHKTEDIINRGGGRLAIKLYNATKSDGLAKTAVHVSINGMPHAVKAGGTVILEPGGSICLPPRLYHTFWGQKGAGTVLVGEVSLVNDDYRDNRFLRPAGRFPPLVEDAEPLHLLVADYAQLTQRYFGKWTR